MHMVCMFVYRGDVCREEAGDKKRISEISINVDLKAPIRRFDLANQFVERCMGQMVWIGQSDFLAVIYNSNKSYENYINDPKSWNIERHGPITR